MTILEQKGGLTSVSQGLTSYGTYDSTAGKYFLAGEPRLYANFSVTKSLQTYLGSSIAGPAVQFSRASSGTYVDYDRLVKTASINTPRFEHNPVTGESLGLLIEESRTNIIDYSEGIGLGAWSVTGNIARNTTETVAPDGQFTSAKWSLVPGTTYNGGASIINSFIYTPAQTYSLSFFIKSGGSDATTFAIIANSNPYGSQVFWVNNIPVDPNTSYTISRTGNGSYIPAEQISNLGTFQRIAYPNGWTKVVWSGFTIASGGNPRDLMIYWTGYTGVTGTSNSIFYVWGFQLEVSSFPTSYIKTTGSSGTRSADVATLPLSYEDSRTNLFTRSEEFNVSPWANANLTINTNAETSPTGTQTAERIANTPNQLSYLSRFFTLNLSTTYTLSFYVKNVSGNGVVAFEFSNILYTGYNTAVFDLTNQTISGDFGLSSKSKITSVGSGWYRIITTFTTPSSGSPSFNVLYFGAYGSVSTTNTFAVWGAQLEVGANETSYIPTTTQTVTRPGPSSPGYWFDITKGTGTTFFEYDLLYDQSTGAGAAQGLYGIYDATTPYSNGNTAFNDVEYWTSANHRPRTRIKDTVSSPITESNLDIGPGAFSSGNNKLMFGYDSSTHRVAQNGSVSSASHNVNVYILETRTNYIYNSQTLYNDGTTYSRPDSTVGYTVYNSGGPNNGSFHRVTRINPRNTQLNPFYDWSWEWKYGTGGQNAFPDGTIFVFSCYARSIDGSVATITFSNPDGQTVIHSITNEWKRVYGAFTAGYSGNGWFRINRSNPDIFAVGSNFDIACLQAEVGTFPTSYIPNSSTSSVTRSADNASMTGTNFSSWYNQTEGTVYCNFITDATSASLASGPRTFQLIGNIDQANPININERLDHRIISNINGSEYYTGGINFGRIQDSGVSNPSQGKITVSQNSKSRQFCMNGRTVVSATIPNAPAVDTLIIGSYNFQFTYLNGTIKKLAYYPKALSPAQLQYLTQ